MRSKKSSACNCRHRVFIPTSASWNCSNCLQVSITAALINDPLIIFLDEPTTGLDPQARRNLWQLIKDIRDKGTTVIITTHYMDEAEVLCDRVAVIDSGKIIAIDSPDKLIDDLVASGFERKKE